MHRPIKMLPDIALGLLLAGCVSSQEMPLDSGVSIEQETATKQQILNAMITKIDATCKTRVSCTVQEHDANARVFGTIAATPDWEAWWAERLAPAEKVDNGQMTAIEAEAISARSRAELKARQHQEMTNDLTLIELAAPWR
jgi:hypothetical protein